MVGKDVVGVEVVDRHREEPVHLRRVQGHGQHPGCAGGDQQVGNQPGADGDPRRILLVRARVREVRDDRGDVRRRCTTRGVEHQEQLEEVLLNRWHQRLDH